MIISLREIYNMLTLILKTDIVGMRKLTKSLVGKSHAAGILKYIHRREPWWLISIKID
jgi:hypothetical protein